MNGSRQVRQRFNRSIAGSRSLLADLVLFVGQCESRRDARAQIASLYYAFAVDVLSDLMSMVVLPLCIRITLC